MECKVLTIKISKLEIALNRVLCGFTGRRTMDYAYTLQFSFEFGPKKLQFLSKYAKKFVNITIGTMQLGFCMVYLVFIGKIIFLLFYFFSQHLN